MVNPEQVIPSHGTMMMHSSYVELAEDAGYVFRRYRAYNEEWRGNGVMKKVGKVLSNGGYASHTQSLMNRSGL